MERISVTVRLLLYLASHLCPPALSFALWKVLPYHRGEISPKTPACSFHFLKAGILLWNALVFAGVAWQHTAMACSVAEWGIVRYLEEYHGVQSKSPSTSTHYMKIWTCVNALIQHTPHHYQAIPHHSEITSALAGTQKASQKQPDSLQGAVPWKPRSFALLR